MTQHENSMTLISGYRESYEPWDALEKAKTGDLNAIEELWENLYHQGDVDSASYASVPKLVELGILDLVSAIEIARHSDQNPNLSETIKSTYLEALNNAILTPPNDEALLKSYYVIHASIHGQLRLAKVLDYLSIDEIIRDIE